MSVKLTNNAETLLATDISASATSMVVEDASSFPTLGVGDYFYCTIQRASGSREIVKVTSITGNTFGMTRGQEGTAAISFSSGSLIELRMTVQNFIDLVDLYVDDTLVSDTAYNATSWNAVTTIAPSKNAVRDKIVSIDAAATSSAMLPVTQASTLVIARDLLLEDLDKPIVLLVSGQSNAQVALAYSWEPQENVFEWNWDEDPTHVGTAFTALTGTTMRLGYSFANEIAKANPLRKVYLVNIGRSGTPIANWLPAGSPDMYDAVKDNVEAALAAADASKIDALLWWQGENDVLTGTYQTDFETLHTRWRTETWFAYDTPVVLMGLSILVGANYINFNAELVALSASSSARAYVHTGDLPVEYWDDDVVYTYVHMTAPGYEAAGRMAARVFDAGEGSSVADQLKSPTFRAATLSMNQNTDTSLTVSNTQVAANAVSQVELVTDTGTSTLTQSSTLGPLLPNTLALSAANKLVFISPGDQTFYRNGVTAQTLSSTGYAWGVNCLFPNTGLRAYDTNSTHSLTWKPNSNLTADRVFSLTTGDADRTLDISAGSVTISTQGGQLLDDTSFGAMRTTMGAAGLADANTFTEAQGITKNQNAATTVTITNTQVAANAAAKVNLVSDTGTSSIVQSSSLEGTNPNTLGVSAANKFALFSVGDHTYYRNSVLGLTFGSSGFVWSVNGLFPNTGLRSYDTNSTHSLTWKPNSNLTADRVFSLTTGDADRTLDISAGDVTISTQGSQLIDDTSFSAMRTTMSAAGTGVANAFTEAQSITKSQNAATALTVSNTNAGASAQPNLVLTSDVGSATLAVGSSTNGFGAGYGVINYPAALAISSVGNLTLTGNSTTHITCGSASTDFSLPFKLKVYTVATLPAAGTVGAYAMAAVSDANGPTYNATVAGGGAVKIPVMSDGTNWKCR